jgi:replicative DNA helicase
MFVYKNSEPNFAPVASLPPQNIEMEEAILGGILLDPSALDRTRDLLDSHSFYIPSHRHIYDAALGLSKHGRSTDLLSIAAYLQEAGLFDVVGGFNKLTQLVERTISAVNIDSLSVKVTDHSIKRDLLWLGDEVKRLVLEGGNSAALTDVLSQIEELTLRITSLRHKSNISYLKAKEEIELEALTRDIEQIEKTDNLFQRKIQTKNLMKKWGLKSEKEFLDLHARWLEASNKKRSYSLDEYLQMHGSKSVRWLLDGWIPEKSITVIHSLGGVGKTTLINTLAKSLITGTDWSGYEVSRPAKILWVQTDQGPTVTNLLLDRQGFFTLSPDEKERQRILDDWYVEEYALLERELDEHQYDLVIIDSLASVSANLMYRENDQEFARPLARLRHIANKKNCAFLILHHSGKGGEMRGTTAIYNAADQVWKMERMLSSDKTAANLTIEKSRFREDKKVYRLQFNPEDSFWMAMGQVTGSGESETIEETITPALKSVLCFLRSNENVGFAREEIAHELNISEASCKKILAEATREGLINSLKGHRQLAVYFSGQLAVPAVPQEPELHETYMPQAIDPAHGAAVPAVPQEPINVSNQTQEPQELQELQEPQEPKDEEILTFKAGDRVVSLPAKQLGTVKKTELRHFPGTFKKDEPYTTQRVLVRLDSCQVEEGPAEFFKLAAPYLFTALKPGQHLQALKHPDHTGFIRRKNSTTGTIRNLIEKDGKYYANCETDNGIERYNLEAVEILA